MADKYFGFLKNIYTALRQKFSDGYAGLKENLNTLPPLKDIVYRNKEKISMAVLPLLIISMALYSCSSRQKGIFRNIKAVFEISDEVRAYYRDKPDYWGLSSEMALKNNILSPHFIHNGKIVLNGSVEVNIGNGANGEMVMPGSQSFDISLQGLNKAQCISYTENVLDKAEQVKLMAITIVTPAERTVFEWGGIHPLPISPYTSKDFCADSNNTVIWSLK